MNNNNNQQTTINNNKGETTMKTTTTTTRKPQYDSAKTLQQSRDRFKVEPQKSRASLGWLMDYQTEFLLENAKIEGLEKRIEKKEKESRKYGDHDGKFAEEIAVLRVALNNQLVKVAGLQEQLSRAVVQLNEREYNEAVCRAVGRGLRCKSVPFMDGRERVKYERVRDHIELIVEQFCDRFREYNTAYTVGDGYEAVHLLDKNEYKALKKDIEYFSYCVYGNNRRKYSPNDVGLVLIGCINTKGNVLKPCSKDDIMKQLVKTINRVQLGVNPDEQQGA